MKRIAVGMGLFFISLVSTGQKKLSNLSIAITNAHTAKPFSSFSRLLYQDWHPGIETGTSFSWSKQKKHEWFQTFNAGYFYHRWVQHTVSLYSELGYRYKLPLHFFGETKLGIGYMHAIADSKIYKIDSENGVKNKTNLGRPQGMASFSLELQKGISKKDGKIFVRYQQRLQFPFVKNYVPLLPYNMLMTGIKMPINSNQ